jgi:hypothetical protein
MDRDRESLRFPYEGRDRSSDKDTAYSSKIEEDNDFKSNLIVLRDYSFINPSKHSTVFTIHRLVQLTVRT